MSWSRPDRKQKVFQAFTSDVQFFGMSFRILNHLRCTNVLKTCERYSFISLKDPFILFKLISRFYYRKSIYLLSACRYAFLQSIGLNEDVGAKYYIQDFSKNIVLCGHRLECFVRKIFSWHAFKFYHYMWLCW